MRFRRQNRRPLALDITPLVDVVFLLLIFFMVTTTFSSVSGLKLNLPQAENTQVEQESQQVVVTVDRNGRYYLGGETVPREELADRLLHAVEGDPHRVVVVQADRDASHGDVVKLLDVARSLGLSRLAIAAEPMKGGQR